jgi:GLPGLI family protein
MMTSAKYFATIIFILTCFCTYGQKFEVLYAQFDNALDTARYATSPFHPNPDTLAKWIFLYADGISLCKQPENSPYEKKIYLLNKVTSDLDDITTYNMSKNDVYYNDYNKDETRRVNYFFDVKYIIEDVLPNYEWTFHDERKMILNYSCKRASARYPLDRHLLFDVWYTEDIAAVGGPMDVNGLPGLILEVARNKQPFYRALSVKTLPDSITLTIQKPLMSQKAITFAEYQKLRFGVPFENHNKRPPTKNDNK